MRRCTSDDPDRERFLREAIDRAGGYGNFDIVLVLLLFGNIFLRISQLYTTLQDIPCFVPMLIGC